MSLAEIGKLKRQATDAVGKGKYKKALDAYHSLANLQPTDGGWSRRAGEMHRYLDDEVSAVVSFTAAVDKYATNGFIVQAIAVCKSILRIEPENRIATERLARLTQQRHQMMRRPEKLDVAALLSQSRREQPPERAPKPNSAPPAKRRRDRRTIPPGAAIDEVTLADALPSAPVPTVGGSAVKRSISLIDIQVDVDQLFAEYEPSEESSASIPIFEVPDDAELAAALEGTPLLSELPPASLASLAEKVTLVSLDEGQQLFGRGDAGDSLYIIDEGEVAVIGDDGQELSRLRDGGFFGELAVITNEPRKATVVATTSTQLLELTRDVVSELVAEEPAVLPILLRFVRQRLVSLLVESSPLFAPFAGHERERLTDRFDLLEIEGGADLIVQDEPPHDSGLYILLSGQVTVTRHDNGAARTLATLGFGDIVGEMSLLTQKPAVATVTATRKVLALRMSASSFREVIMTHPQVLMFVGDLAAERERAATSIAAGEGAYDVGRVEVL